jgi:ubiquinone/menaquinone biosynthesis C-methylase UbiE
MDNNELLLYGLLGFVGASYAYDVIVRPHFAAKAAREEADKRGKPLLNVGCGTPTSSLRALLLGPQLEGDVNIDISAPKENACGPDSVCYGDAHNIRFPDKHFGAALCTHVLEHLDHPEVALSELHRVADVVIVVVPKWWCPHTWFHPGHKWYISENMRFFKI